MPAARPAAGSGSARASASPAARRVRSRSPAGSLARARIGELGGSERPGDAAAPQEVAVAALGRRHRTAVQADPVARLDGRVPGRGHRKRGPDPVIEGDREPLRTFTGRAERGDAGDPRTTSLGEERRRFARSASSDEDPERKQPRTHDDGSPDARPGGAAWA